MSKTPSMGKSVRIDHAKAAGAFLQKPDHVAFHDKRLWDLRSKRDAQAHGIPEWEQMRELASGIKEHTLSNLAGYLAQFTDEAEKNGVTVHFAANAEEHNELVYRLMSERGMTSLVKSKSMLTDECYMRDYLEPRGITVMETDLGERIQQLDHQDPSHMVVPAVHKLRADVAELFGKTIGTDPHNSDIHYLAESQRMNTRPYFVREKTAGMTGCNFAVAETGTVVVCTNEGNADLSANVPPLHIASIGIEKIIPAIADLGVFVRMLSRSALRSPITQYTSHFRAPRPGTEMHYILVDNGRSERLAMDDFWFSLKCIRCGACMRKSARCSPRPDVPLFPSPAGDLRERFTAALTPMGGNCVEASSLDEVKAMIAARFGADAIVASAVPGIDGNRALSAQTVPASLEDVDVGVVHARFGVAETGSVWFSEQEYVVNALGYLSQHLVVLLDLSQMVEGLQQVYRHDDFKTARYAMLVTGPSATADIEGVLIHGAQGVRSLTVVWLAA